MPAFAGMTGFGGRSDINKQSIFPKTTLAIQRKSSYLARMQSITSGDLAGLAQLVERFVYTEDVGSSSLSSRTISFYSVAGSASIGGNSFPCSVASNARRRL